MLRREFFAGLGAVAALAGCSAYPRPGAFTTALNPISLPPVRLSVDRIIKITVCTRPFRAQGPRLDVEEIGEKTVVHNYGHGGSGWSLSWGSASVAVRKALATGATHVRVIG